MMSTLLTLKGLAMINHNLLICIVSFAIFLLGLATRRFGLSAILIMLSLVIAIFLSDDEVPFPYGCVVSIFLFVAAIVLHGKSAGKNSLLYQYSPYNPNGRLPIKMRLVLLMLGAIVALTTLLAAIWT